MTEQHNPRVNDICVFPQSHDPDAPYGGIMLRDLFAAAALTGMGTWAAGMVIGSPTSFEARAKWACQQADAMLRERGK